MYRMILHAPVQMYVSLGHQCASYAYSLRFADASLFAVVVKLIIRPRASTSILAGLTRESFQAASEIKLYR